MAQLDSTALSNALSLIIDPKSVWQMNRASVLTSLLPFREGAGKVIAWDNWFGAPAPADATYAEGTDVTTFNADTVVQASLGWGGYADSFSLTGKAIGMARSTPNQDFTDLCKTLMYQSTTRLAKAINQEMYAGTGATNHIQGLTGGTAPALGATGVYAGIDRATYPQWASNVLANGGVGRALSWALMRDMRKAIYIASGERVDLIVCSPNMHEKYGALFDPQRRYVQEITLRGQKFVLDAGYGALEFDGIPVVMDADCPDGEMLFLSTQHAVLRQLPTGPCCFENGRAPGFVQLHGTPEEQFGTKLSQLTATVNVLAHSGDYCRVQLVLYPQLQVDKPNAHGVLADLLTT